MIARMKSSAFPLAILLALFLAAASIAATVMGVGADLAFDRLPLVFLNGWLLFFAILCVAFAASVSFDRLPPALGVPLALVLVSYLINALGTLWPDAAWIRTWSVFHLAKPQKILGGAIPAGWVRVGRWCLDGPAVTNGDCCVAWYAPADRAGRLHDELQSFTASLPAGVTTTLDDLPAR